MEKNGNQKAEWYVLGEQENYGPYTLKELQEHYVSGYVSSSSLLWADGKEKWCPLSEIDELAKDVIANNPKLTEKNEVHGNETTTEVREHAVQSDATEVLNGGDGEDDFVRWQEEIKKAEEEAARLKARTAKHAAVAAASFVESRSKKNDFDGVDEPTSPPEGGEEFTDDDGTVYRWNRDRRVWVPQDECLPGVPTYKAEEMVFDVEEEVFPTLRTTLSNNAAEKIQESKPDNKRKSSGEVAKQPNNNPEGWFELKINTHVYVTGLPTDVTSEEVAEVFSKCGIIKEDPDTKKLKIKLYTDKQTNVLKGDALVTYLKEPSVDLAIKLLDGAPFRPGDKQLMSVSQAKFEQRGNVFVKKEANKQKKKKLKYAEQKALGWGGFDDAKKRTTMSVLLKNMFTQEELMSDPNILADLEADVTEECVKLGPLERLKVYKNSSEGVVMVKFKDRSSGLKCIERMNGRWFGGRRITAVEDDGLINYAAIDAADEERRLENFGAELEAD